MSEVVSAPFRGVDLGLPVKPITLADAPSAALARSNGAVLVDIPAALSRQSIVVSQWAIAANLVVSRVLGALPAPTLFDLSPGSGQWSLPSGIYYYQVTATDAAGETNGSNEVPITLTQFFGPQTSARLNWTSIPGAVNYKLYRSTTSGGERTSPALIYTGTNVAFTDNGTAAGAGAVPANNTTSLSPSSLPQFNRLGRLLGGPLRHRAIQTTGTGISAALVAPWETPFVFPDDISNLGTLWDGEADASPPMEAWMNPMPVDIATTLNSPISLAAGEQLGIFLGVTPMVGQNVQLYVVNARWSLTYDVA